MTTLKAQLGGDFPGSFFNDPIIFILIGFFVLIYFTAIRPQNKRAKEHRELIKSLQVGDEVATISGMIGTIKRLEAGHCDLEVGPNVVVRMQKHAISSLLPKGSLKDL